MKAQRIIGYVMGTAVGLTFLHGFLVAFGFYDWLRGGR